VVVELVYKTRNRIKLAKVVNISLLTDGRYCFQCVDKRYNPNFREVLIRADEVKAFYQH
jgi:ribonuclease HI